MALDLVGQLFTIIAPVLLCVAAGYVWVRLRRPFDAGFTGALVSGIGVPCLIFSALTRHQVSGEALATLALATCCCYAGGGLLGVIVLRFAGLPQHSYLPALMFPSGNVGLPLCLLAFGNEGLALSIVWFAMGAIAQFTVGISIASGTFSLRWLARQPLIYVLVIALAFSLTGVKPPEFVSRTTEILGGLLIPLMLLSLGASLASMTVARPGRALTLSLVRLLGGFVIGLMVAWIFGLTGAARGVVLIQSAMPVAIFNYLFALRYEREPADVAGMIVMTTLMSFLTLPALMMYVL